MIFLTKVVIFRMFVTTTFLVLMSGKTGLPWVDAIAHQMTHPAWHGFTFYDFIFPLFLFLTGVSLTFSVSSSLQRGRSKAEIRRKALGRMLILILLGILYKNAPVPYFEPTQIRYGSVLGRIGLAGFVTMVLYLRYGFRLRVLIVAVILLAYYAALFLIPVPGYGAGDLSFEGNLAGWFDRTFMPGRLLQGTYDELALATQLPAMTLTMIGALAGDVLLRHSIAAITRVRMLLLWGLLAIVIGLLWGQHFPINKHLWSSSFILLTAGMALLFLAVFYVVIDVWGYRRWAFFFQVIGLNSLLIYLVYRFVDFNYTSRLLFSGLYKWAPEPWHEVYRAIGALLLVWLLLYFCYRKKWFLKV